jgi:hypothetical protein
MVIFIKCRVTVMFFIGPFECSHMAVVSSSITRQPVRDDLLCSSNVIIYLFMIEETDTYCRNYVINRLIS